ncbi:MAG: transcription/translation regulatory transformer protein RfaH [Chloroflexi bacterium]|nr:transcription/translation regulatory transformer protein RfaH [Chloroflexota bacterium]
MMSIRWYALRVKPHKEQFVCQQLQAQSVQFYYPSVRVKPVNPRSATVRPFFPGYLFVQLDIEQEGVDAYRWLPGVHGLVMFGGVPAVVHESLIAEIRGRLQKIEAVGGLTAETFQPGDRVRIVSGPLAGYEAIFDARLPGKERVQVLLAFLSAQPKPVKLDAQHVRKVDGEAG